MNKFSLALRRVECLRTYSQVRDTLGILQILLESLTMMKIVPPVKGNFERGDEQNSP